MLLSVDVEADIRASRNKTIFDTNKNKFYHNLSKKTHVEPVDRYYSRLSLHCCQHVAMVPHNIERQLDKQKMYILKKKK